MADWISYVRARDMRRSLTPPEARLWRYLKGQALDGFAFRKQHPIGPYILDFYCASAKLAVEVDGAIHDQSDQIRHDQRRTAWLAERGVRVIRIAALDVRDELNGVLDYISREVRSWVASMTAQAESPPPSRR